MVSGTENETMRPAIAITMGDPCGIGPEVVVKALADPRVYAACRPVVVGNVHAMEEGGAVDRASHGHQPHRRPQLRPATILRWWTWWTSGT